MNRIVRRLLRWGLGEADARVFASELEELYGRKVASEGRAEAERWRRREVRRAGVLAIAAHLRLVGRPARATERLRHPAPSATQAPAPRRRGLVVATIESSVQDVRFAFRMFSRRPTFTIVAVATLALGICATAAVYGIADAVLLRSLPYRDPHRLVSIWTSRLNSTGQWVTQSLYPPEYRELLAHASTLENVALYFYAGGSLQGRGDPMNLIVGEGSATLADVAGIQPRLGRWFRPEEVGPQRTYVAVLGDALWRERFGADPNVVGTTVLLEQRPYTIIGVMPPEFRFRLNLFGDAQGLLSPRDNGERPVWVPMGHNYGSSWYDAREGYSFEALARLRPGVSLEAVRAEIETLVRGEAGGDRLQVHLARRDQLEVAGLPAQLLLLAVPSTLLLLIACVNVATLLLGESEGRRAEIAIRTAIGAGSRRVLRQLLTESVVLGLAACVVGVALAFGAIRALVAFAPASSVMQGVEVNLAVVGFACGTGMLAGASFGLVPALLLGRRQSWGLQVRRGRTTGQERQRAAVLIGLEVALTVVLLVAGGLFTRTLLNLNRVQMGFNPERLVAFPAAIERLPAAGRAVAYSEMLTRMEAVPGVIASTGSWSMPLLMSLWTANVAREGDDVAEASRLPQVDYDVVMPDYHETMGIPLLAGRCFTSDDRPGSPPVVIVSRSTAAKLWPTGPVLGQRIRLRRPADPERLGPEGDWHTVVGVVGDVRYGGLDSTPPLVIYRPFLQNPGLNGMRLVLIARTAVDPSGVLQQLEAAARSAYPAVLLREGTAMSAAVSESATDQRYRALLVVAFGLVAILLAAAGIFGVVARSVAQRSRELAVRMALGADSGRLRSLVLGRTLLTAAVGACAGSLAAGWGSRFIARFLFGVQSSDPFTYSVVILTVLLVSAAASYLPARRLLSLEPARVLKQE